MAPFAFAAARFKAAHAGKMSFVAPGVPALHNEQYSVKEI